jgi:hypothetical protein
MTATEFATELKARDLRLFRNRIVSDDCPGVTWKPVVIGGQIDRARTLRKVIRERRDEIVRQVRIGAAWASAASEMKSPDKKPGLLILPGASMLYASATDGLSVP